MALKNNTRQKKNVRKQQIIDAICSIISKYGSEHVTIRNISKEINLTEAAIYRHFTSKKEIFLRLVDFVSDLLINDIKNTDRSAINDIKGLYAVFLNQIKNIQKRKGTAFLIISEIISLGDKDLNKELSVKIREYINTVHELLNSCLEKDIIKKGSDINTLSEHYYYLLHGLICGWYINNYDFDLISSFDRLWENFKNYLIL